MARTGRLTERPLWWAVWLAVALAALAVLESARWGVEITRGTVGPTPVIHYARADADGPPVVIAHGFAGSSQMMQGYALSLAQAGYRVTAFDFEGHGRNPVPMSGDVTSVDGTTRLLVDQTRSVVEAVAGDQPVALLGHSMATDILVRVAAQDARVGPLVLVSAFSLEIGPEAPRDMLIVSGQWEGRLADFALEAARMVDPGAQPEQTVQNGDTIRRGVVAPLSDHVSILFSRTARSEARDWLNRAYARSGVPATPPTGQALLALLFALVALTAPLAARLRPSAPDPRPLPARAFAAVALLPALVSAPLAVLLYHPVLPVLVADYLALHLAIYAAVQGALLWRLRRPPGPLSWPALALLLVWGLGAFGLALDRYGANFWPTPDRLTLIAALALGAVPFMLTDAWAAYGAPLWQRIAARLAFLASLGGAVALSPEQLFFVLMIAPVIVLFYLVFGTMGRFVARRTGPLTPGLALGLILAWALGVSFPLFSAGG